MLDLSTIRGPGFGYRLDEIERTCRPPRFPRLLDGRHYDRLSDWTGDGKV